MTCHKSFQLITASINAEKMLIALHKEIYYNITQTLNEFL